ncbi:hypothetical protein TgHK011_005532 [Trichoderma gracile]|nr:hypothetical protein TgHK011_005532 [Trichoderma gracile]
MSRPSRDARLYGSDSRDSPRFPPEPYNLYAFYSASDDPWIPNAAIPPAATLNQSSRPPTFDSGARSFQGYRSAGLPSECGTAPEDSGYGGTRSTYSLVESAASIAENDRCTDTRYLEAQTAEQLIGDLTLSSAIPIYQQPGPYPQSQPVKHRCDQCEAVLNTRSELKKHRHRHNKPYKHKRTVHREYNENDPVYICRHDPCNRKKGKPWPRADNFRSHLSRAHGIHLKADNDLREYRHQWGLAKFQEHRYDGNLVRNVHSGRRPAQLQDPPLSHARCDDIAIRSEATEAAELRGVGSSVADVVPEPRPAQLQDSPDLRGNQSPVSPSDPAHTEFPDQSNSPCTPSGEKPDLIQSNAFGDLEMSPVPVSEPLGSNQAVERYYTKTKSISDTTQNHTTLKDHRQRELRLPVHLSSPSPVLLKIASLKPSEQQSGQMTLLDHHAMHLPILSIPKDLLEKALSPENHEETRARSQTVGKPSPGSVNLGSI